ncbi:hypothetical protein LB557_30940 [Mesorhizobium sp. BR115XR7A]|uniref:hypothetical protein n=1 Tax=Mesorhizobium sp. BR115XR7A TaxID=2876645 RepID=UPI001CCF90CD|nr:hypothetical protein [Mesorhizobium sp. BR115XR7A]MBZ9910410.1 hypothetical protein [Mesorhizobium sp. BR115XR7A]MBZ9933470.1 hypothetical protein [Mesorhizobium sp. BR1-1-5]
MTRKQFLVQSVAGWLAPLPKRTRDEIKKCWPELPLAKIESEFGWYLLERDASDAQPEGGEIEKRYTRMQTHISDLIEDVAWLRGNNLGTVVEQVSPPEYSDSLKTLYDALVVAGALLPRARKYLPKGQQVNPRHLLALRLGLIVTDAGLPVNKKPTGPLCRLVEILLEAAKESPSSAVMIVTPILGHLKKSR